jgi:hypothetical protein
MTLYLPDGKEWTPREGMAQVMPKAATGVGVGFYGPGSSPLMDYGKSPQKFMLRAQNAYRTNAWVGAAEAVVTRKTCGLPWHFEDPEGDEYEDDDPKLAVITDLLANLTMGGRKLSWYDFESILSRHVGLCGMGYVYLDQMEAVGKTPLGLVYVNPARVWPAEDERGNLTGWVLDAQDASGRGGTPYSIEELIPFYLDQPDFGHIGIGLYERLMLKAQVAQLADQHAAYVIGTGGRIAGIVSPKEGTIPDEAFKTIVQQFRNVNDAPDAAKRTIASRPSGRRSRTPSGRGTPRSASTSPWSSWSRSSTTRPPPTSARRRRSTSPSPSTSAGTSWAWTRSPTTTRKANRWERPSTSPVP